MGMFDWVAVPKELKICPYCGKDTGGFQTKEFDCTLYTYPYYKVNRFYALCDSCGKWVEYARKWAVSPSEYQLVERGAPPIKDLDADLET